MQLYQKANHMLVFRIEVAPATAEMLGSPGRDVLLRSTEKVSEAETLLLATNDV